MAIKNQPHTQKNLTKNENKMFGCRELWDLIFTIGAYFLRAAYHFVLVINRSSSLQEMLDHLDVSLGGCLLESIVASLESEK